MLRSLRGVGCLMRTSNPQYISHKFLSRLDGSWVWIWHDAYAVEQNGRGMRDTGNHHYSIRQLPTWRTGEAVKLFMRTGVTFGERLSACGPFNPRFNRVCSDLALSVSSDPLHEGRLPRTPSAR